MDKRTKKQIRDEIKTLRQELQQAATEPAKQSGGQLPVPRPKNGHKFKATLPGPKRNQNLRLRLSTLLLLRQKALAEGLSISEMADKLLANADRKPSFKF